MARLLSVLTIALLAAPFVLGDDSRATFSELIPVPLNRPQQPVALSIGDFFNGDGRRDFGVAYADSASAVRFNPSIGVPGPRIPRIESSPLRVEAGGNDIVLADVNGDGIDDWCRTEYAQKTLAVLAGGPSSDGDSRDLNRNPVTLRIADFDADGILDYLVGYASSPASVFRGNGHGGTSSASNVEVAGPALAIADIDGDGALDIVSGGGTSPRISVSRGSGALTFTAAQTLADLPADGISYIEGLAVRTPRAGELPALAAVVRNTGVGRRRLYVLHPNDAVVPSPIYETTGLIHAMFADIDRDSQQDLVIVDTDLKRVIVRGGNFAETWPLLATIDVAPHVISAAVTGDVSGDRIPDLVLASRSSPTLLVYVNTTSAPRRRSTRH